MAIQPPRLDDRAFDDECPIDVLEDVGNHRLEGRRESRRARAEDHNQYIDLPDLIDEGDRTDGQGTDQIETHQQLFAGDIRRQRCDQGSDQDVGDHLQAERHPEDFAGIVTRQFEGEKTQRYGGKSEPEQPDHLRCVKTPEDRVLQRQDDRSIHTGFLPQASAEPYSAPIRFP